MGAPTVGSARETLDGPIVRLSAGGQRNGIFWGWAPDLSGTAGVDADSPCISLKTKNAGQLQAELGLSNSEFRALGFKSSNLGLVLEKQFPWGRESRNAVVELDREGAGFPRLGPRRYRRGLATPRVSISTPAAVS